MVEEGWRLTRGVLMTNQRIPAYGGISIPTETLEEIADQLGLDGMPMHVQHDLTRPVRSRNFRAFVERREDGVDELRFSVEIHEDDLPLFESTRGMSATLMGPLERDEDSASKEARLRLSADHAWFDDEALIEAEGELLASGVGPQDLVVQRAYQFSFVPDPQIFLDISYALLLSMGASALWDGIKALFNRRRTPTNGDPQSATVVNLTIEHEGRKLVAHVKTGDPAVAGSALDSLDKAAADFFEVSRPKAEADAQTRQVTTWDASSDRWSPPT